MGTFVQHISETTGRPTRVTVPAACILSHSSAKISRKRLEKEGELILRSILCMLVEIQKDPTIVAIAANQMGINLPLFVSRHPLLMFDQLLRTGQKPLGRFTCMEGAEVFLLPSYVAVAGQETSLNPESCLSYCSAKEEVPQVRRYNEILFTGTRIDYVEAISRGKLDFKTDLEKVQLHLTRFGAQVAQHETDHIFGKGIWQHL